MSDLDADESLRTLMDFTLSLHNVLRSTESNIVHCPLSVILTLLMIANGAKGNTEHEIFQSFWLSLTDKSKARDTFLTFAKSILGRQSDKFLLTFANGAFLQSGFNVLEGFSDKLVKSYNASIETIDFKQSDQASARINAWVEEKTNQKIQNLMSPTAFDEYTKLVLVNAVYMKGQWASQFPKDNSIPDTFHLLDDTERSVMFMFQKSKFGIGRSEKLDCTVLELPYVDEDFVMYVFLPYQMNGLSRLEDSLTSESIKEVTGNMRKVTVNVWLPRFKAESSVLSLEKVLPALGIANIFDEHKADLSAITGKSDLYVSSLLHKTTLVVDEEGSEAAAATAGVMRLKRSLEINEEFRADHPFLYSIAHKPKGVTLFFGRVESPVEYSPGAKDEL